MSEDTASGALTTAEAMSYLRISRAYLYRLLRTGDLPYAKLGKRTLIRRADADALLQRSLVIDRSRANVFG